MHRTVITRAMKAPRTGITVMLKLFGVQPLQQSLCKGDQDGQGAGEQDVQGQAGSSACSG